MVKKNAYVIGNNTKQSLSPTIFNYWFKKYNVDAEYGFKEIKEENFEKEISLILKEKNLCGLNITIPFKEKIIKHLDLVDESAKKMQSVNCLTINKNKKEGTNTDWLGFNETIKQKNIKKDTAILLGYGGAARAIIHSLNFIGFRKIKVFNRTFDKIKNTTNKNIQPHKLGQLEKHIGSANIIINTIPTNIISQKQARGLEKGACVCDIVYRPKETAFLNLFSTKYQKIYGLDMLLYQAIPCFERWFGIKPEIDQDLLRLVNKKIL